MSQREPKTKAARKLKRLIERAGHEVTLTRRGHLKVRGPAGIAVVQSDLSAPNGCRGALAELHRHAGIDLRGTVL